MKQCKIEYDIIIYYINVIVKLCVKLNTQYRLIPQVTVERGFEVESSGDGAAL